MKIDPQFAVMVAGAFLAAIVFANRLEVVVSDGGPQPVVFIVNKITGTTSFCTVNVCSEIPTR